MKLSRFDIGAEIISILTKGIYPDPRDAVREYIQNAIDANATKVGVNVGQDYVSVIDDGDGMDYDTMRRAIRLGVSDKQPGKDVGFMGIGIYSSFHLCNMLEIYSKTKNNNPSKLAINFEEMRLELDGQKSKRLQGASSDELMGLQSLLESCLKLTEITEEDYPNIGTTVELTGLNPILSDSLLDFEKLKQYLQDAVPLHFDPNFKYGKKIEQKIEDICKKHDAKFEIIDLKLTISGKSESLFRPYTDNIFNNGAGQEPHYEIIGHQRKFIGIAWGVLNSERRAILNKLLRGFILKKQGFAIGNRSSLIKYFAPGGKATAPHFNRHTGEIIIINPKLLPNASRSWLYPSNLQKKFEIELEKVADKYNKNSENFQRYSKGIDIIKQSTSELKSILGQQFEYEKNVSKLVKFMTHLRLVEYNTKRVINAKYLASNDEKTKQAKDLLQSTKATIKSIQESLNELALIKESESKVRKSNSSSNKIKIAAKIKDIPTDNINEKYYENLEGILRDLDVEIPQIAIDIFRMIDSDFLVEMSKTKADYQNMLQTIKQKILDLIEGDND